jgi:hypothetical protein
VVWIYLLLDFNTFVYSKKPADVRKSGLLDSFMSTLGEYIGSQGTALLRDAITSPVVYEYIWQLMSSEKLEKDDTFVQSLLSEIQSMGENEESSVLEDRIGNRIVKKLILKESEELKCSEQGLLFCLSFLTLVDVVHRTFLFFLVVQCNQAQLGSLVQETLCRPYPLVFDELQTHIKGLFRCI